MASKKASGRGRARVSKWQQQLAESQQRTVQRLDELLRRVEAIDNIVAARLAQIEARLTPAAAVPGAALMQNVTVDVILDRLMQGIERRNLENPTRRRRNGDPSRR
jgi:hypothetical protein